MQERVAAAGQQQSAVASELPASVAAATDQAAVVARFRAKALTLQAGQVARAKQVQAHGGGVQTPAVVAKALTPQVGQVARTKQVQARGGGVQTPAGTDRAAIAAKYRKMPVKHVPVSTEGVHRQQHHSALGVSKRTLGQTSRSSEFCLGTAAVSTKNTKKPNWSLTDQSKTITSNYLSPTVDANLNGHVVIGMHSNAIENDRQLAAIDIAGGGIGCGSAQIPLHRSLFNSISSLLGLQGGDPDLLLGSSSLTSRQTKQRDLQVRLSMNDPLLSERHRIAHRLYVTGKPISELRAAGVDAGHLVEIGVTYDDWSRCYDLGVRDLVFLDADWDVLLRMGFLPKHLIVDRAKSGPTVVSQSPLNITFQCLEQTMGLTVDEAVFTLSFTTADFAVLGESLCTLMKRGFDHTHVAHMQETVFNFETALRGSPAAITHVFRNDSTTTEDTKIDIDIAPLKTRTQKLRKSNHTKKPFGII